MEEPGKKKDWITPELSVLVRSHPEEAALAACKWAGNSYPSGSWTDCWNSPGVFCNALAAS
jgi:hypothetical protein